MNCNQLSQQAEHMAWQQRVSKELGNSRKYQFIFSLLYRFLDVLNGGFDG